MPSAPHSVRVAFPVFVEMPASGSFITREELYVSREELAGPEGSRSNLADVYIGYLRRKLRPLFGDGAILAVRGKGYLLKLP